MPTRVASRDNEVDDAPEFQRKALSESGYFRKSLMGMDTAKWLQLAKNMTPGSGRSRKTYMVRTLSSHIRRH